MAGFFGLFGSKTKYVDREGTNNDVDTSSESFFLSPDDAKTFGNIDYMRTPKKIRRTFPKTQSNQNTEFIQDVASVKNPESLTQQEIAEPVAAKPEPAPEPVAAKPQPTTFPTSSKLTSTEERRRADTSMDMFRNMARNIKK